MKAQQQALRDLISELSDEEGCLEHEFVKDDWDLIARHLGRDMQAGEVAVSDAKRAKLGDDWKAYYAYARKLISEYRHKLKKQHRRPEPRMDVTEEDIREEQAHAETPHHSHNTTKVLSIKTPVRNPSATANESIKRFKRAKANDFTSERFSKQHDLMVNVRYFNEHGTLPKGTDMAKVMGKGMYSKAR